MNGEITPGNRAEGFPVWARLAAYLGFPIVVALFFLGQSAGYIPSKSNDNQEVMIGKQNQLINSLANHRQRQEDLLYTLSIAVRVLCENTAHTPIERTNCLAIPTNRQKGGEADH